jgi:VanZ family protein
MLRKSWMLISWSLVALVFYLSLMRNPPAPLSFNQADKLEHALAYATMMLSFCQLYGSKIARVGLFLAFVIMGVGIEFLQKMTDYRVFEYADMLANAVGVAIGWGLAQTRLGTVLTMLENYGKS